MLIHCLIFCPAAALELKTVDRALAEKHYEDLSSKPFFAGLVDYILSGPVVAMVWEGKGVVLTGRKIIGAVSRML
jgi:nucleoside-diphosphate kinase